MSPMQELVSFHIIECDKYNQFLMTWTYPTISEENKGFILKKLPLIYKSKYVFLKYRKDWFYIMNFEVQGSEKFSDISKYSLVIIAKDFYPKKYEVLLKVFCKFYTKTGNPVQLVKPYLSVFTTGSCSTQENGNFVIKEFENNKFASVKLKELINMFGIEIILLYTAILLKKRIVIYHESLDVLLKCLQSINALLVHRNIHENLIPVIENTSQDFLTLKVQPWFVAGVTNSAILKKTDLFDILVNLPALEINIMPHAKESLIMTKIHKDIATHIVQLAETVELTDLEVSQEINKKTLEILEHLKSLSSIMDGNERMIGVNDLKSKNLHPNVENFLFNLAVAENLIIF